MVIEKVYLSYEEMMDYLAIDNITDGLFVLISPDFGGEHAGEVYVKSRNGYELYKKPEVTNV